MNATPMFVPALLVAALCATGCSSPDGTPTEATSAAAEAIASSAPVDPPSETRHAPQPSGAQSAMPASLADAGTGGGYFSCAIDDDCVAAPYIENCCYNGWKIAVASDEAEAFVASETCEGKRPICPEYMVEDRRVPACNESTRTCEMVAPDAGTSTPPAL